MFRVDAEELLRVQPSRCAAAPCSSMKASAFARMAAQRAGVDIPAGRSVLVQALDLVAPGGDGGREVGHGRRVTAEWLPVA